MKHLKLWENFDYTPNTSEEDKKPTLLNYCNQHYNMTRSKGEYWDGDEYDHNDEKVYSSDNLPPMVYFDSVDEFISEIGDNEASEVIEEYNKKYLK